MHLEKLIKKSIIVINIQELSKTIDVTMLRIRNDLMLKRKQKSRLKIILMQLKRK